MGNLFSNLSYLECSECSKHFNPDVPQRYCDDCRAPIFARYDIPAAREKLISSDFRYRPTGMWRWHELLPIKNASNIISLGEGDAPLMRIDRLGKRLGLKNLFIKDESLNPTGTFKALGLSSAISKAKELGITKLTIPTAGNAGAAMAAYSARGGMEAHVVMPRNSPKSNIIESQITGAVVALVDGLITDAANVVNEMSKTEGWFDLSTFKEPYRVEGKKIMGYELAEVFQWYLPDVIIYPTGGGTGLVGMWKAFEELQELEWLRDAQKPRLVSIQSDGCAPIVRAFESSKLFSDFWDNANTIASGLCVPKSFADKLILRYLRESKGTALSVSDREILEAQLQLAQTEGIFASPEGAATLAGLIKLVDLRWLNPEERIVIFNTGMGLKYIN